MARVSIGLPVYNGQRYLAEALRSFREQTFDDFTLTVCDNASTDGTQAIVREFAAADPRVLYHRNETNIGAAPNFNRVYELAPAAPYFKWAAADDVCAPEFLERCVAVLDEDPGAALAYTGIQIIDKDGKPADARIKRLPTDHPSPSMRYRSLFAGHSAFEIFGVIRRDLLERTPRMGGYSRGDIVLLARLAMYGRLVEVPEPLFYPRRHEEQSIRMVGDWDTYARWFDPRLAGRRVFPVWRWTWEYFKCLPAGSMPAGERLRCLVAWGRYVVRMRGRLAGELWANLGARRPADAAP